MKAIEAEMTPVEWFILNTEAIVEVESIGSHHIYPTLHTAIEAFHSRAC